MVFIELVKSLYKYHKKESLIAKKDKLDLIVQRLQKQKIELQQQIESM
jgi:hypothetical protein